LRDKRVYLESLGCSKNLVDSEVMLGKLSEYELTDSPNLADGKYWSIQWWDL